MYNIGKTDIHYSMCLCMYKYSGVKKCIVKIPAVTCIHTIQLDKTKLTYIERVKDGMPICKP